MVDDAVEELIRHRLRLVIKDVANPRRFLKQIREVSGLLVAKEEGLYEFVHLSLQEYLTSAEIRESSQEQLLIDTLHGSEQLLWWARVI